MQTGSIGKGIIGNRIKKTIESGKFPFNTMLEIGTNIPEMTKNDREKNKENFNNKLHKEQSRNINEGR